MARTMVWKVGIYVRVSTDQKNQQESIPDQIESLKRWLVEKNVSEDGSIYELTGIYEDTGCSGTNFDREGFINMKKDMDCGLINMVLTRDLSRFSRNYVTAGYYLEDYFILRGIRFVSILDNVDTFREADDIIPFKNILNEMYVKDCSRRTRDGLRQRMLRGSCISSKPPYGYKAVEYLEGRFKTIKLVPLGDESTDIVRRIFALYMEGWGMNKIASYLNSLDIPPPSAKLSYSRAKYGVWSAGGIRYILTNPKYGGYMFQHRWEKLSYKNKKVKQIEKEHWILGGEFQGIIPKEQYDLVQDMIKKRNTKSRHKGELHIFSLVLFCGDCGGPMIYRKNYKGYKCSNSQKGGKRCTAHSIKEETIIALIKEEIGKQISSTVNYRELKELLDQWLLKKYSKDESLEYIELSISRIDRAYKELYMERLNGSISERNFLMLSKELEERQERLFKKEQKLKDFMIAPEENEHYENYMDMLNSFISMEKVDRAFVERFIKTITVKECQCKNTCFIHVSYRFEKSKL